MGGRHVEIACGDAAWLDVGGLDVIVNSIRTQVKGIEPFTAVGIDPRERHVLVVKSTNHFRAAFGPVARAVVYMSAPGTLTFDFTSVPYRHLDRNRYPWVDRD